MASQILITMDDLETAVRLNAAFEAAKLSTAMFSSLDDVRASVRASTSSRSEVRWRAMCLAFMIQICLLPAPCVLSML
jgi:hypothetical protein